MRVPYWDRLLTSPAGQIMGLLRRGPTTVDELAHALGLTGNAVRQQLAVLERDGLVGQGESRRGVSKPARTYILTADAELLLSRAYPPVLTQLLHVLDERLDPAEFDELMRNVGRRLLADRPRPSGNLRQRAEAASALLNELGGQARVEEENGGLRIRGYGCPLSAATQRHPEACNAVESLLAEFAGIPVTKCCDAEGRLRCCFEVGGRGRAGRRRAKGVR
jgi:predicted ArsR family transcriptional regulator